MQSKTQFVERKLMMDRSHTMSVMYALREVCQRSW